MTRDDKDLQQQVNASFEAFRSNLQEMLAAQARESVDTAIGELTQRSGPFRVEDVQVDVVIRGLKLATGDGGAPEAPGGRARQRAAAAPRQAASARRKPVRRTKGKRSVREILLEIFEDSAESLDTDRLREILGERGVQASAANLHQQLRRLVQAGEIVREGRGVYHKTRSSQVA